MDPTSGLADQLRDHTRAWHRQAERSGIVHELLNGRAYQQLERALEQHRDSPGVRHVASPETYRAAALEADLDSLCGPRWQTSLPLLRPARDYAEQIADAANGDGVRLIGHAYVRYLGDLNGGRILRQCLMRSPGLQPEALTFCAFPDIHDLQHLKVAYRAGFDQAAGDISDLRSVIEEALTAFRLNVELSESVAAQQAS